MHEDALKILQSIAQAMFWLMSSTEAPQSPLRRRFERKTLRVIAGSFRLKH
jgi:hypothetical protein